MALLAVTVLVIWGRRTQGPVELNTNVLRALIGAAWVVRVAGLPVILPPATWTLIPFDDDWAPRYQVTVEGVRLLRQRAVVGWQWALLGGHQTSADLSQSLTHTPVETFVAEMHKWGVRHLLVWSQTTTAYLDAAPDHFTRRWTSGLSVEYELAAPTREAWPSQPAADGSRTCTGSGGRCTSRGYAAAIRSSSG